MDESRREVLRNRRAEIYSFFAQKREEQAPTVAQKLYEELLEINKMLDDESPTETEIQREFLENTAVEHPSHYTSGGIECIDAMKAMLAGYEQERIVTKYYWHFLAGQVLKYLWRWPLKERPLQDLKKARWYLDKLIADVENQDHAVTERHSDMGKEISE